MLSISTLCITLLASTWTVDDDNPADFPDIGAAVTAATAGDERRMFDTSFSQGPVPIGILVQPDGRFAYIANTNANLVTVLDLEALAVAGRFTTGNQPDGLAWVPAP